MDTLAEFMEFHRKLLFTTITKMSNILDNVVASDFIPAELVETKLFFLTFYKIENYY